MSGDITGEPDDTSSDMSGDARWITYDELAKLRGIARSSAERLVQRNRWRRQRGNDRVVRILVPMDVSGDISDDTSGDTGLLAGALTALGNAVAALREQLAVAEARGEGDRNRADRAEAALTDERARANAAVAKADTLRDRLRAWWRAGSVSSVCPADNDRMLPRAVPAPDSA